MHSGTLKNKVSLSGLVERITFCNEENGFIVLKVKVQKQKDLITITGNASHIAVGEYVQCSGDWYNDFNHGLQFRASFLKSLPPSSLDGMEKYLGSGLIKGIGEKFAKKLVGAFGLDVFNVIEKYPEKLTNVYGIGKGRAERLTKNWFEQKIVRNIMLFLQSYGVGTSMAMKIYKCYGENAIEIVSENPYKLSKDIRGIGFLSADKIAISLGIAKDSIKRARAGVVYVLLEATSDGHCGITKKELLEKSIVMLETEKKILLDAIQDEVIAGSFVVDFIKEEEIIFFSPYYFYEKYIATKVLELKNSTPVWGIIDFEHAIAEMEKVLQIKCADIQVVAIKKALSNKFMIITGGPGTGKTTIINGILNILQLKKINVKLCAPTGRAAKKLSESTNMSASTIHRLLEVAPEHGGFARNEQNTIECDYLIIDEFSMVDVKLFASLLKAVPMHSAILLVGDVDQLPSVGAGKLLCDMIDSKVIEVVRLVEIFRQSKDSEIIFTAHLINKGIMPRLNNKKDSDFYFIDINEEQEDVGAKSMEILCELIKNRIPNKFNFDSINDIQVLCPMQKSGLGAKSVNIELQKVLNVNYQEGIEKFGQNFVVGDKVMQIENNYNSNVYNGDIGFVEKIDRINQQISVIFDGKLLVEYEYSDLDQLVLAYAITIHKSQGSEYQAVVILLTMQNYMVLKRNLLYTAITRGKKLVVVIGQKKAFFIAIKNTRGLLRNTKLCDWLVEYNKRNEFNW